MTELRQRLLRVASRFSLRGEDCEDVAQEALLRLCAARSNGSHVIDEHGFAIRATARLAIDRLRALDRSRRRIRALPGGIAAADNSDAATRPIEVTRLYEAIARLPPRQAAAVTLRKLLEFEYPEIGLILDTSEANCRSLCRHGLQRLRESLRIESA